MSQFTGKENVEILFVHGRGREFANLSILMLCRLIEGMASGRCYPAGLMDPRTSHSVLFKLDRVLRMSSHW